LPADVRAAALVRSEIEVFRRANMDPLLCTPSLLDHKSWIGFLRYQAYQLLVPDLDSALHVSLASDVGAPSRQEREELQHLRDCRLACAGFLAQWLDRLSMRKPRSFELFQLALCSIRLHVHADPPRKRSVSFELNVHAFYRNDKHRIPAHLHHLCNGLHLPFAAFASRFAHNARDVQEQRHKVTLKLEAHLERFMRMALIEETLLVQLAKWVARWPPVPAEDLDDECGRALDQLPLIHPVSTLFHELQSLHNSFQHLLVEAAATPTPAAAPSAPKSAPPPKRRTKKVTTTSVQPMDVG
jgi:hypothetical protein